MGGLVCISLLICLLALPTLATAEPCSSNVQQSTVQFSEIQCECCVDLDDFIQEHDFVFTLFYSNSNRLNRDIGAKFRQTAEDWKYTRVHFGLIDVDKDRYMSQKWNPPEMIPTNIVFKFGRPVNIAPEDFERLKNKWGGAPEGMKWLLNRYLKEGKSTEAIHYAVPVGSGKRLRRFIKEHEVVFVGFFEKENDAASTAFHKTVWELHRSAPQSGLGAAFASVSKAPSVASEYKLPVPSVAVFLDGELVQEQGVFPTPETHVSWASSAGQKLLHQFVTGFLPLRPGELDGDGGDAPEMDEEF